MLTPPKSSLNNQIINIKTFIFEKLLDLQKQNKQKKLWIPNFLDQNLDFIDFVSKNHYSRLAIIKIKKWYHSNTFHKDLNVFNKDYSLLSSKQKGLERYKGFQPILNEVTTKTNNSTDWLEPVKRDIISIFHHDKKSEKKFSDFFMARQHQIRQLTDQEIEYEKTEFLKISGQKEMLDWLNNSASLSNKMLVWWFSMLRESSNPLCIISEHHHMMPCYMHAYGISEVKIQEPFNLIPLTPAMHVLTHAIRFLEYGYYEDYQVINRLHHNLKNGELIQADHYQTVYQILDQIDSFAENIRKGKFVNLPDQIQKMFSNTMIWKGIFNYQIKTIEIPGGTVANYYELICYLRASFSNSPDIKYHIPTENEISAVRKYLNGQRPSIGLLACQLMNANEKMLQSGNKLNETNYKQFLMFKEYTCWEYCPRGRQKGNRQEVFMPPVMKASELIQGLEIYQKRSFSENDIKLIGPVVRKRQYSAKVSNWKLIKSYTTLTEL